MADLLTPFAGQRAERLAQKLVARFGSVGGALFASREQLQDAAGEDGDACELIFAARDLFEVGLVERLRSSVVRANDPVLVRYLKLQLGDVKEERLHAIFLDPDGRYLADECVGSGGKSILSARMRDVFRRAMELRAAGILLAHNHPSGSYTPSAADIAATDHIAETAERLDFKLLDHLIVTRAAVFSIKEGRLL